MMQICKCRRTLIKGPAIDPPAGAENSAIQISNGIL